MNKEARGIFVSSFYEPHAFFFAVFTAVTKIASNFSVSSISGFRSFSGSSFESMISSNQ